MKLHTQMILIAFLVSFIFVSLSLADDPLSTGKEAFQKGDVQKAISALREAVKNDKKNPEPYFWLGTALLKADSVDQAVTVLYQARELDSANAKIYSLLGDAYSQQKIFVAAIPPYQKAIELDSANSTYYVKLGKAYMKARQYSDAARAFKRVLSLDTSNVDINRELANLYVRSKPPQYAMAAPLFERLMKLRPDSLNFQVQLVAALFHTNNFEKLIPVAQGVLQRDSNQTEVLRALGVAYVKARDNDNAVKILLQLEQRGMLKVEDYIELAKAQKALERFDDAIESYEKAYRADSINGEIYYDLGTLYMKRKRYPEAVAMFEKRVAHDTTSGYLFASHLNSGMCLMQTKEFRSARNHIVASIEIRPDNVQAWLTLAQCYAQMDSAIPERRAYRKVIDLASSNENNEKYNTQLEEGYRMEGFYLLLDKKYPPAIENLKKALQIDSKNCQTLLWAAQAYTLNNVREEGIKYCKKVLELCPKNEDAKKLAKALGIAVANGKN